MNKQGHISDVVVLAHLGVEGSTYAGRIASHMGQDSSYPQDPSTVLRHLHELVKTGHVSTRKRAARSYYDLTQKGQERLVQERRKLLELCSVIDRAIIK